MSRSWPKRASRRACAVIGAQHEALLRSIGGNPCEYCSKRGSAGCAWEVTPPATPSQPQARVPTTASGKSARHRAAELASHLGP